MDNLFWEMNSPSSLRKLAKWDDDKMEMETVSCPVDEMHQRSGKRLTDLSVVLPDGAVQDFVWTWYSECLIQSRTLGMLRSKGFTGFEVKPVTARFKTWTKEPPPLWELILTGWAGTAKAESGVRLKESEYCPACRHLRYTGMTNPGELISDITWDGSDFFMVWPLPKYVFVTERVVQFLREHHCSGVVLTPASEIEQADEFTPGRLSYYMPDERARELGEASGIY